MIPNIIIFVLTMSGSGALVFGIGTILQEFMAGLTIMLFAIVIMVLAWTLWAFSGIVKEIQNKHQDPLEKITQVNKVFEPIFALLKMMPKPDLSA